MLPALLLRGADLAHFNRKRLAWSHPGALEIRYFGFGVIITAAVWMSFPLAFFGSLNTSGRAYTAIVLCGMTCGSVTVLAPSKTLSALFSFFLVVPTAILFCCLPVKPISSLVCSGFYLYASSRLAHRATIAAIELARSNEGLLLEMERERRRTMDSWIWTSSKRLTM